MTRKFATNSRNKSLAKISRITIHILYMSYYLFIVKEFEANFWSTLCYKIISFISDNILAGDHCLVN